MWYVKDEFSNRNYFVSDDVRESQAYAIRYNKTFKFAGQRMFHFCINDFSGLILFWESKIDVCHYTYDFDIFGGSKYKHPFAIKHFDKVHRKYLNKKYDLIKKLCKKYHLWSYNAHGRKCDGFDF